MNPNMNANMKVSKKKLLIKIKKQGPNNARYKTALCKHFNTPQGCSYGDKCQFAHGQQELKQIDNTKINNQNFIPQNNKQKNNLNYKIVKCKNWEKDKTCKYGAHCTFAHGDSELRNKADNLYQMGPNMGMMFPTFMMDMSQMMGNPQFDMSQMTMAPMMMGMNPAAVPAQMPNNVMSNNENK